MTKSRHDKLVLLVQTAGFYNSTNRSLSDIGSDTPSCVYMNPNPKLPGCAVGRLIKDNLLKKKLDDCGDSGIIESEVWNLIPDDVREWGQAFLVKLQNLHDAAENWYENGLSPKGMDEFNAIKSMIIAGEFDKDRFSPIVEEQVE